MNLQIPGVGTEAGPLYATEINTTLVTLDRHDHTQGNGVPITPAALNINANVSFNNNLITNLAGMTLIAQASIPASNTIYQSGNDLFFVDGLGTNIPITKNGAVAGTPGSIANLVSPASASYVAGNQTFVWQSLIGIAANMDFGSAILRNLTPNSTFSLTLQPPTLTSSYTLTLPIIPAQTAFMTMDNTGKMRTDTPLIGALTTSNLSSSANIIGTQLSPTANILPSQLSSTVNFTLKKQAFIASGSFTVPANVTQLIIEGAGGGGGGGGGGANALGANNNTGGAGGGNGAPVIVSLMPVTPGQVIPLSIGSGGASGSGGAISGTAGLDGSPGGVGAQSTFGSYSFPGGKGGNGGSGSSTSRLPGPRGTYFLNSAAGGPGGAAGSGGFPGDPTAVGPNGIAGNTTGVNSGGGGGGGGAGKDGGGQGGTGDGGGGQPGFAPALNSASGGGGASGVGISPAAGPGGGTGAAGFINVFWVGV